MSFLRLGGLLKNNIMFKIPIILHCTKNYLQNSLNLIRSLNLYHKNLSFYLYTLNFKYESKIPNLNTIFIEDENIKTTNNVTNNAVFVGSTSELSKLLKQGFLNNKE